MAARKRKQLPRNLPVLIETLGDSGMGCLSIQMEHAQQTRLINVKGALPGEHLTINVMSKKRRQWYALPHEFKTRSEERVPAPCVFFLNCGGCTMQHIKQKAQLEIKNESLLASLAENQVVARHVLSSVTGPSYLYRRRARLGVRYVAAKGRVLIGFREAFGGKIVDMSACMVLAEPFGTSVSVAMLQQLIASLTGYERIPQIELVVSDSESAIIIRHLDPFCEEDLGKLKAFNKNTRVMVFGQAGSYESVKLLFGKSIYTDQRGSISRPQLSYSLPDFGITLFHDVADFVQVNQSINQILVQAAVSGLNLDIHDRILELFCGIGNFSLPMARKVKRVKGLEGDVQLVNRANQNAKLNGLDQVAFFQQVDLYEKLDDQQVQAICRGYNKVLVDPPRSGLGSALQLFNNCHIERLAYISCNPETFASDAAYLLKIGFVLETVRVFDMFPQTSHVETLGIFSFQADNSSIFSGQCFA